MSAYLVNFHSFPSYEDKFEFLGEIIDEQIKLTHEKQTADLDKNNIRKHFFFLMKVRHKPSFRTSYQTNWCGDHISVFQGICWSFGTMDREGLFSEVYFLLFIVATAKKKFKKLQKRKKKETKQMAEEKRPVLLKIEPSKKRTFSSPEPFSMQLANQGGEKKFSDFFQEESQTQNIIGVWGV